MSFSNRYSIGASYHFTRSFQKSHDSNTKCNLQSGPAPFEPKVEEESRRLDETKEGFLSENKESSERSIRKVGTLEDCFIVSLFLRSLVWFLPPSLLGDLLEET
mmetsp:Transcript_22675/g.29441  ORF Transcript_22675/g.29441 Transcript_22675/m.29441 type:complete len:104 (-) Transcript_22675:23-334(-)